MDAVFAIDMSLKSKLSIPAEKTFLKNLAKTITTAGKDNEIALISYSTDSTISYPFQDQFDFSSFSRTVDNLAATDNGRSIDNALIKAYEELFKPRHIESNTIPHNQLVKKGNGIYKNEFNSLLGEGIKNINSNLLPSLPITNTKNQVTAKKNKLLVLFVAGGQSENNENILPKDAARLLYDLGIHIIIVAFNETNKKVVDIVNNNKENIYKQYEGKGVADIWSNLCHRFKEGELLLTTK